MHTASSPVELDAATVSMASAFDGTGPALVHDTATGTALRLGAGEHGALSGDLLVVTFR